MSETFTVGAVVGERWAGSGPTVVLLHAERYDVLAYDRRGYGQTPAPADDDPRPLQDLLGVLGSAALAGLAVDLPRRPARPSRAA